MPKFNSKKTPGVTEGQMEGRMDERMDRPYFIELLQLQPGV